MKASIIPLLLALTLGGIPSRILYSQTPHEPSPTINAERAALQDAAQKFCAALRAQRIEGLPSDAQLRSLSPLITPELRSLIDLARSRQQQQMRKHPDDKPDWIEGDVFSSLFEGVTKWELGSAFSAPDVDATVKVKQTYTEANQKPVTWTDTLVFKTSNQQWLLDDIRMGGDWAFKSGDSLRSRLPGGGKDSEDHDSPDEAWHIAFQRKGEATTRITLTDIKSKFKPVVLFGDDGKQSCPLPTWVMWSPNCDMLAIRLGDSAHFARTLTYRLAADTWESVAMPEFYLEEKKTMTGNGFKERDSIVEPAHWQDANTLVVHYFGDFSNGSDGDGFDKFISIRISKDGKAAIAGAVDTPGNN